MSRNIKFTIPVRDDENPDDDSTPVARTQRFRHTPRSVYGGAAGIRLGLLCLMLVLVILAMKKASQPESWNWLFQFGSVEMPAENPSEKTGPTELPGVAGKSDPLRKNAGSLWNTRLEAAAATELEREFWKQLLQQLDGQQQLRLFNLVQAVAKQSALPPGSTAATRPVLNTIKSSRQNFALKLQDTPSEGFANFQTSWNESLLPAFVAVVGDTPDSTLVDDQVRALIPTLRQASGELIRDKTAVGRVREAYAWFSAWADVFDQPIEPDVEESATVTQLISQPEAFRGRTLHIEGTALRVERVEASHNALGIDQYYVIWIRPDDPSIYPYCVYTLMAPVSLMGEPGEKMREVEQRVTTSARFFKNRLFQSSAARGTEAAFAPVLLTASVEVPPQEAMVTRSRFKLPGLNVVLIWLAAIGGLAAMIAVTVYRSTTGGGTRTLPRSERLTPQFTKLQEDDRVETTIEKLQKLTERASRDGSAQDARE